jgi:hypothetical protein
MEKWHFIEAVYWCCMFLMHGKMAFHASCLLVLYVLNAWKNGIS